MATTDGMTSIATESTTVGGDMDTMVSVESQNGNGTDASNVAVSFPSTNPESIDSDASNQVPATEDSSNANPDATNTVSEEVVDASNNGGLESQGSRRVDESEPVSNTTTTHHQLFTAPAEWSTRNLNRTHDTEPSSSGSSSSTTPSHDTRRRKGIYGWFCGNRNRMTLSLSGGFFLLAAVTIVALVIPFVRTTNNTSNKNNQNNDLGDIFTSGAVARVKTLVWKQNWSDPLTLMDPVSPQTQALYQLAAQDYDKTLNASTIKERYALLVVWFGLGGSTTNVDEIQNKHECDWSNVVICNATTNGGKTIVGLDMQRQGLDGTLLQEVSLLSNLELLNLFENSIQGQVPTALYSLTKLTSLQLGRNALASILSEDIGKLSNLQMLQLHDNYMFGDLPTSLRSLTNLKAVQLWRTQLGGPIVEFVVNWPHLEELTIAENEHFNGTIPTAIGNLSLLQSLVFRMTSVSGTIPTEIGNLSNLEKFIAGHLLLLNDTVAPFGPLPSEFGNCRKLEMLSIEPSRMTGTIPTTLGLLSSTLVTLILKGSQFEGSLPSQLASLVQLNALTLQGNDFTGTLPEWLGRNLTSLRYCNIYWNLFEGMVPESLCRASLQFYYDCNLECDCCGPCGPVD